MTERETTFNRDAYDLIREVGLDPIGGAKSDIMKMMINAGFYAMQKVQYYGVDVPTWLGAQADGLAQGMTAEEANRHADDMVGRAQASGLYGDRTQIERGTLGVTSRQNDFVRLFTTLGSYMFAKFNVTQEVLGRAARDIKSPEHSSVVAMLKAMTDLILLYAVEAVLYNMIKGTLPGMGDDDDEGWTEFLAKQTLYSALSTMPFVRDASGAIQGYSGGGAYSGISETFGKATAAVGEAAKDGEISKQMIRSLNDAFGTATPGYPSTAIWRLFEGAGLIGDEEFSPLAIIMGR